MNSQSWLHWAPGRLGTGYRKLLLAWWRNRFDCYLIHYPPTAYIPSHLDIVGGARHFRLNVCLWGDAGAFEYHGRLLWRWWRAVLFRPDKTTHGVQQVTSTRLVLSVGWTRRP